VHEHFDSLIPAFEMDFLGKTYDTPFATGNGESILSPIDAQLVLGRFRRSTNDDVSNAIAKAVQAHANWASLTWQQRVEFADRWARALSADKYRLALGALYEVAKSRIEAIGEAEEAVDIVEYYASELTRNRAYACDMRQLVNRESTRSILKPYGVFGIIAPFNFPLALSVNMIAGAILTGNTVVYKPSPRCAFTGLLLAQTLKNAGLPDGVVNVVLGGAEIGESIFNDPRVSGIAFTGSHKAGMTIYRSLAMQPYAKPVIAEMGGKNPAYISSKGDVSVAAEGVARSAFGLQGQKCSACSVAFVERSVSDEFADALRSFAAKLKVGDPRRDDTFLGPVYSDDAATRLEEALAEARRDGQVAFGGHRLIREELFVPFLAVRVVDNLADGISEGNQVNYGLSAGIYTNDRSELDYFLDNAKAGVLYANRASGATTGAWPGAQSFCGWKGSGVSGKGGLGPNYLPQFLREQSQTILNASY
jgi:1-pyrroline-5-carboxylate dehydrogenase